MNLIFSFAYYLWLGSLSVSGALPENWREFVDPDTLAKFDNDASRYDPGKWEGDITNFEPEEIPTNVAANAVDNPNLMWPNSTIPYEFSTRNSKRFRDERNDIKFISTTQRERITQAMNIIMLLTGQCVKFVERKTESDYVRFQKGFLCYSDVGRTGGRQIVSLSPSCLLHHGCIQHELMHVLGFFHEQSRLDRDKYVTINWENIAAENKAQFSQRAGETFGLPYDYESVMHYEVKAFARDDQLPTILPNVRKAKLGQQKNLSPLDVTRIYKRYKCGVRSVEDFVQPQAIDNQSTQSTAQKTADEGLDGEEGDDEDKGSTIVYSHRLIRSNSDYVLIANSFQQRQDAEILAVIATIQGTWTSGKVELKKGQQKKLTIKVPSLELTSKDSVELKIRVAYKNGLIKWRYRRLQYVQSEEIILIQLDKPMYKTTDAVRFRVLILNPDLKLSSRIKTIGAILKDPDGEPLEQKKDIPYAYLNYPGYFEGTFAPFCHDPVLGTWTLEIVTTDRSQLKEFRVANYRLPRFSVSFNTPSYLTNSNDILSILPEVKDRTGNPVFGTVNIVVKDPSSGTGSKVFAPQAIEQLKDPLIYKLDKLWKFCQERIDRKYLEVEVTATEAVTKQVEKAVKIIPYHCHPFVITTSSVNYQPGLESTATIRFVNHDDTPLADDRILSAAKITAAQLTEATEAIPIRVEEVDVVEGMVVVSFQSSSFSDSVTISVEVQGAQKNLTLQRRRVSASIRIFGLKTYRVGETVKFQLRCNHACQTMYYAVVSRKGISEATAAPMVDEESARLQFVVTADMAPSVTIVAYYALHKLVRNDAVEIFVSHESAVESVHLKAEPDDTRETYVVPGLGKKVKFEVTAAPNSLVGLLAVDKNLLQLSSGHDISAAEIAARLSSKDAVISSREFLPYFCEEYDNLKHTCSTESLDSEFLEADLVIVLFDTTPMPEPGTEPVSVPDEGVKILKPLIRKDFRDSFMFVTKFTDNNGKLSFSETVPDSITTWAITAFAASSQRSLGLTKKPNDLRVFQEVYIHMDLPTTMIVNETTTVNMTLFNFRKAPITNTLAFRSNIKLNEVDTRAGNWSVDLKTAERNAFWLTPIPVGPFAKGTVTFTAELYESNVGVIDRIQKKIQILQPGTQTVISSDVYTLSGANPTIEIPVETNLLPANIVQESVSLTLTVFGDTFAPTMNQLTLPDMSKEFEGLIRLPHGCGEQNMAILMPNVFLARYLRRLGPQALTANNRIQKLTANMEKGFDKQASFRIQDGSYNAFGRRKQPGSTWLTAYVVRGLTLASEFIKVDQTQIDKSIRFLDRKQKADGSFIENGTVIDRHSQGAGGHGDALTAFVLLTYAEAGRTTEATRKAKTYLESSFNSATDPYVLGLTCYVFSRLASHKTQQCVKLLNSFATEPSPGRKCWLDASSVMRTGQQFTSKDVETTAYALLALSNSSYDGNINPVVDWLLSQRNGQGGFKSTQDTIVALHALSELQTESKTGFLKVKVNGKARRLKSNSMDPKIFSIEPNSTKVEVELEGQGTAKCQLEYKYNEIPKLPSKNVLHKAARVEPPAPAGSPTSEVDLTFTLRSGSDDNKKLEIELCPSYQGSVVSGMVMVEIEALTGYTFNVEALNDEINPEAGELQSVQCAEKCALYFRKIDSGGKPVCITMPLYQSSETEEPKPRPIVVYRYYQAQVRKLFEYSLEDIRR